MTSISGSGLCISFLSKLIGSSAICFATDILKYNEIKIFHLQIININVHAAQATAATARHNNVVVEPIITKDPIFFIHSID